MATKRGAIGSDVVPLRIRSMVGLLPLLACEVLEHDALDRYHHFYGDAPQVECPTSSGRWMTLDGVARELSRRLASLFLPDAQGRRPFHGDGPLFANDPHFRDHVVFNEYFHGDSGRGLGASFQGWTLLVTRCLEEIHHKDTKDTKAF